MKPLLPCLLTVVCCVVSATDINQILILVMDQDNPYHSTRALQFVTKLTEQALGSNPQPDIRLLSHRYRTSGAWTLFPIITDLYKTMSDDQQWLFICEEETRVNLPEFLKVLSDFDAEKEWLLGLAMSDDQAVIIHHYAFHGDTSAFKYPHLTAGVALSRPLLKKLVKIYLGEEKKMTFHIDAVYEFTKFMYDMKEPVTLTNVPEFCIKNRAGCATYQSQDFPSCGTPVTVDDIFFAVKTCQKFKEDRIPVLKDTWVKDVKHIEFYSDVDDPDIPSIDLGVPNTERGHCGKTAAILRRALEQDHINSKPWFVLADDDTMFSVARLRRLLACYDPEDTLAIGERYGYGLASSGGYDYLTLGGGMVLSKHAITELIEGGFKCPQNDSPDDMLLGMTMKRLKIPMVHSPHFHQARPNDYAKKFFRSRKAVSFHKFWLINPRQMYRDYMKESIHDEL